MNEKVRKGILIAGIIVVVGGIIGLLYPFVGNYINSRQHASVVQDYKDEVAEMDEDRTSEMLEEARAYNERLAARCGKVVNLTQDEKDEYYDILSFSKTGVMGYLEIPKLDVLLPIYHGTDEAVLQKGVGHLEGSSFPVGGETVHVALTSHSGLPSSELFTNLDELEKGDVFSVTVLGQTVMYKVFDMYVALPDEVEMEFEEGVDYCTLATCTPVGVNTHRYVVRGKRITESVSETADTAQ